MIFPIIFFIIIILLFMIRIHVKITKRSKFHIEIKIFNIKIVNKTVEKNKNSEERKLDILGLISKRNIGNLRQDAYKAFKIIMKLKKNITFKKASANVHISNANYVKGGYYIGAIETVTYFAKNITDKFEVHHKYKTQDKDLKISFCLIFEFNLLKNIISFIKLIIIISRLVKKGDMKNGTTSNRKFNDDCNVVN